MSRAHARACLVLLPTLDGRKQERLLLAWVADHRYVVTSVTSVPAAAAALAEAGLVDVVMVVRHTRATLEMAGRVGQTEATIDEIRPSAAPLSNHDRTRAQILDASRRGVPLEAIAAVLDVPLATVLEALGVKHTQEDRRPARVDPIRRGDDRDRRPRLTGPRA